MEKKEVSIEDILEHVINDVRNEVDDDDVDDDDNVILGGGGGMWERTKIQVM